MVMGRKMTGCSVVGVLKLRLRWHCRCRDGEGEEKRDRIGVKRQESQMPQIVDIDSLLRRK